MCFCLLYTCTFSLCPFEPTRLCAWYVVLLSTLTKVPRDLLVHRSTCMSETLPHSFPVCASVSLMPTCLVCPSVDLSLCAWERISQVTLLCLMLSSHICHFYPCQSDPFMIVSKSLSDCRSALSFPFLHLLAWLPQDSKLLEPCCTRSSGYSTVHR